MTLRKARQRAGLTQAELARRSGVQQATISMLETGASSRPSYDTAIALAKVLGEDVSSMFPKSRRRQT